MIPDPEFKYFPLKRVDNPNRQWPSKTLTKAPIWLSTDLRDGNQSIVNPLTLQQKWDFFHMLVEIGFTEMEVSFPAASQVEFDFTRRLIDTPGTVPDHVTLRALSPTREDFLARTVASLQGAKKACVCAYITVSDKQLEHLGFDREQGLQQAVKCIKYLRSITKDDPASAAKTQWSMAFGLESYNEADHDYAVRITEAVKEAWEPTEEDPMWVVLATSTEKATPNVFADQVECFKRSLSEPDKILISIHTHNDRGCAVAAAELGMLAGADMVEGCLFGNGERCGNADLVTLALNLYSRGIHPGLDFSNLYGYKKRFEKLTGLVVGQRAPYAGEFALQAFSGTHQNIIRKGIADRVRAVEDGVKPLPMWHIPYLPIDPEDLGIPLDTIIRVNSQSGKSAAAWILSRRWGLELPAKLQVDFGRRVQLICEGLAREITHDEVLNLFVASYALGGGSQEKHGLAREPIDVGVSRSGGSVSVVASVQQAKKSFPIQLNGSGHDIPSAVLGGLSFMSGSRADAELHPVQQLNSDYGQGRFAALASCTRGDKSSWGFAIHQESDAAQVLAVVSAAVSSYRNNPSTSLSKSTPRIDVMAPPPSTLRPAGKVVS